MENNNKQQIAGAIIIAGIIISGAILLKDSKTFSPINNGIPVTSLSPITENDVTLGNEKAKVAFVLYEDFQCPFCGAISGLAPETDAVKYLKKIDPSWAPFMLGINEYVKKGDILFVYRDFAFLGKESIKSSEAARCAGDQNKFWEFHDYLYGHQNGENQGNFSDLRLKSFAKNLGLDTSVFDNCFDTGKYAQAIIDSKSEGVAAGVTGTPKGFILRDGKIVGNIDGAESWTTVKQKIDTALK